MRLPFDLITGLLVCWRESFCLGYVLRRRLILRQKDVISPIQSNNMTTRYHFLAFISPTLSPRTLDLREVRGSVKTWLLYGRHWISWSWTLEPRVLVLVQVCLSVPSRHRLPPSLLLRLMNRSGSSSILVSAITRSGYGQSWFSGLLQLTSFPLTAELQVSRRLS